jgi:ABC-type multidrug transport system ATPase subunit
VSAEDSPGDIIGVLGKNGAGKSADLVGGSRSV